MNDPAWNDSLMFGLPTDFITQISTPDDVDALMVALPNRDRGAAALALYLLRESVGCEVAFHAMMHAWDHNQAEAEFAFGSDVKFGKALKRVAPPHGLSGSVRLWRGICVETAAPFDAALHTSWTTELPAREYELSSDGLD